MANTLTGLIQTVYQALYKVSRERVGYIPAVTKNSSAERVAKDQTIRIPIAPATTAEAANTPAVTPPDTGDQTISYADMTISKSYHIPIRFNGEELRSLGVSGNKDDIVQQRFAQGFRRLCNLIEVDLGSSYKGASRAIGTAGTTPFNTADNVTDFANVMRILDDNGCPPDEVKLVLDNAAIANLRGKQSIFAKANEADTTEMLRDGKLARAYGFDIHQSGQVPLVTKGTVSGATLTSADYAVAATSLTLASAGTGAINDGDMVNIAGENNGIWYGVYTGDADTSGGGTVVLNAPGLRVAQTTNTSIVSVPAANWRGNLAFHKSAIQLITRAPAMPDGGDMATDSFMVEDPVSGLIFEVREYKQFHQTTFHINIAWGWKVVNSEHVAVLFG